MPTATNSRYLLAADIGGTWTRAACYPWPWEGEAPPRPLARVRRPTDPEDPTSGLVAALKEVWPREGRVHGVGVAAPGPLDPYRGVVLFAPNLPAWREEPLQARLEAALGVPVRMGNDANLAALGEVRYGAGRGHEHVLYLTLGTGVGGGVVCHGRLLEGRQGLAGELGHITVDPQGPPCACGGRGHLEALASGTALVRAAQEALKTHPDTLLHRVRPLTAEAIARVARQGDALARDLLARAGHWVGVALADLCHIFNPEVVVLGGGVSRGGPWLWDALREALDARLMRPEYRPQVRPAALGDDAGLLGAYALWG